MTSELYFLIVALVLIVVGVGCWAGAGSKDSPLVPLGFFAFISAAFIVVILSIHVGLSLPSAFPEKPAVEVSK